MSLASILTTIGTTIEALTPSPSSPAYEESDYRFKLDDDGQGNIERKVFISGEIDNADIGTWGEGKCRFRARIGVAIGYDKEGEEGGGGSGLDGRSATDLEQIVMALKKKSNFHSTEVGPRIISSVEIASEQDRARIYRINMVTEYDLTIP